MKNRMGADTYRGAPGRLRALAATVLLLTAAGPALADARGDAKRHFRDGIALIAAGQIERGIAELKQAYAIKPHPDVLYNIAKAEVDLGNIPEALSYFRQYVATDPEDKEQVQSVMARLQAAIGGAGRPVAPAPAEAPQNVDVQKLIAQLQALISQSQGGAAPAAAPATAKGRLPPPPLPAPSAPADEDMFEAATISAKSRATAKEIAAELSGTHETLSAEDIFEEQIVTASVRSSSEAKAPASLTIIGEDEIRMSGAATIPEILRRVPGIDVAEMNPSDTNISFRGFNRRVSNRVLVLVDGRSVYQDFLGGTFWPLLDVAVQDVSRIEVIRGPGSALYGANAFSGVVNIITKTGEDANGPRLFVNAGNYNTFQGGLSVGGRSGKLSYRTTVAYDRADKWAPDASAQAPSFSAQFAQPNRSREIQRADTAASYDFGKTQVLAGAGFDQLSSEVVSLGSLRTFGLAGQSGFARLEVVSGQTRIKGFWNALRMSTGPEYWPDSALSLRSNVRSDVVDVTAQTGFDFKLLGTHHLNVGAGYRMKSVSWGYLSPTADGSALQEQHYNAFLQDEWAMSRQVTLVLSYRVDRHPLLYSQDVTPGGLVHSPRGTLLYEFKPEQVLRLSVGSAFRAPTFLESYVDLLTPIPNQAGLAVRFQGSRDLRPEQMLQAELGYRGRIGSFQPDVVLYGERVQNLITDGGLQVLTPQPDPLTGQVVVGRTGFENEPGSFFGVGAEIGGKWSPADGVDFGANYSYEKMFACTPQGGGTRTCTQDTAIANQVSATIANTAEHKLNLMATWRTRANFDLAIDAHYVSPVTWYEKSFDTSSAGGVALTPYPLGAYTLLNGRVGYRWIKDKLDTGVAVYNILGDDHREHPFGTPIGRRVLFTASGSF